MLTAPAEDGQTTVAEPPRTLWRFELVRFKDVSGVSGTGLVAVGVVCADGTAWMRWTSTDPSSVVFDDWRTVERKHGHNGLTMVRWIDQPPNAFLNPEQPELRK